MGALTDAFIAALEAHDFRPRRVGDRWRSRCPGHDDRKASLTIEVGETNDGRERVKLHCFAGCTETWDDGPKRIAAAVGLPDGLYEPAVVRASRPASRPTLARAVAEPWSASVSDPLPTATELQRSSVALQDDAEVLRYLAGVKGFSAEEMLRYGVGLDTATARLTIPVHDADGKLCTVLAYLPPGKRRESGESKMLTWRGAKGWRRDLWPRPESLERGKSIYLVEGEADALTLLSAGLPAVSVPGAGCWRSGMAQRFVGRPVIAVPDLDDPGRKAMAAAVADLTAAGVEVRLLDLDQNRDDGADIGDFLLAHGAGDGPDGRARAANWVWSVSEDRALRPNDRSGVDGSSGSTSGTGSRPRPSSCDEGDGCDGKRDQEPEMYVLLTQHENGNLQPVYVKLGEGTAELTMSERQAAEFLRLIIGLRAAVDDYAPQMCSCRFLAQRLGWSHPRQASRALNGLVEKCVIRRVGQMPATRTGLYVSGYSDNVSESSPVMVEASDDAREVAVQPLAEAPKQPGVSDAVTLTGAHRTLAAADTAVVAHAGQPTSEVGATRRLRTPDEPEDDLPDRKPGPEAIYERARLVLAEDSA